MRNVVICCDGTGNEYGRNNTNVVEIYGLVRKSESQVCFYDPGVGTGGWEYQEEEGMLRAKSDEATGYGLQKNVEDAYTYLMDCYEPDDRLFLFGFSRGAFTVRSLAGMLYKCGLLRSNHGNLIEYASKLYNSKDNDDVAAGFRATFSRTCGVYFIGVWDTVESLILNAGKRFHDARLNPDIKFGCHALAIDEKRRDFPPYLWDQTRVVAGQTVEQVWFAGVHSDVGGWYDERGLANVALAWMVGKAKQRGLEVDENKLARFHADPHDKMHESFSGFWKFRGSRVRTIPDGALIHRSVIDRMGNPTNRYKPKNLPDNYTVVD